MFVARAGDGTASVCPIVLAAGAGRRLAAVTGSVPKQFWAPPAGRTLLDETLRRVAPLSRQARPLVVVDRRHAPYLELAAQAPRFDAVYQPCDRGTAVGVLLGLHTVRASVGDPVVLLTPSDHGVADVPMFQDVLRSAVADVQSGCCPVVLLGAEPEAPTGDYGWIMLKRASGDHVSGPRPVTAFVEKPAVARAVELMGSGAVWNTMVVVARASALMNLYRRHLGPLTRCFDRAARLPMRAHRAYFERVYPTLEAADFSRHVLTPARNLWTRVWPVELGWTDLGTPDRLSQWLHRPPAHAAVVVAGRSRGERWVSAKEVT